MIKYFKKIIILVVILLMIGMFVACSVNKEIVKIESNATSENFQMKTNVNLYEENDTVNSIIKFIQTSKIEKNQIVLKYMVIVNLQKKNLELLLMRENRKSIFIIEQIAK